MKRATLLHQIDAVVREHHGSWYLHRQGGSHEIYRVNGAAIPIPRHRELNDYTARQILKQVKEALE